MNTLLNLQQDIKRKVHSGESADFFGAVNESARRMLSRVDPSETKTTDYLEYGQFDNLYQYKAPKFLKENKIIDLSPQIGRNRTIDLNQVSQRTFDKYKEGFSIVTKNGEKYIHINAKPNFYYDNMYTPSGYLSNTYQDFTNVNTCYERYNLNSCDSLVNDGTWNVFGSTSNLIVDKLNFLNGTGALRFSIDNNLFGGLDCIDMKPKSINPYMQTGSIFAKIYIPKKENVVSISLKIGSSVNDYYTITVTAPHDSENFINGWNILKFPLDWLDITGTPDPKSITRLRFEFNTNGASMDDVRIDSVTVSNGFLWEVSYYSDSIFRNPISGSLKNTTDDYSDEIILDYTTYNLLLAETAITIAQEIKYSDSDMNILISQREEEYRLYNSDNKSESKKIIEKYYQHNKRNRYRYFH